MGERAGSTDCDVPTNYCPHRDNISTKQTKKHRVVLVAYPTPQTCDYSDSFDDIPIGMYDSNLSVGM